MFVRALPVGLAACARAYCDRCDVSEALGDATDLKVSPVVCRFGGVRGPRGEWKMPAVWTASQLSGSA